MDLTTVTAALGMTTAASAAINGAMDTAGRLTAIFRERNDTASEVELLGLYRALVDATSDIAATEARLNTVIAEIREQNRFEQSAARYVLVATPGGGFVYTLISPAENEPIHSICPHCFEQREISVLQPSSDVGDWCPRCKTSFETRSATRRSSLRTDYDVTEPYGGR